MVTFSYMIVQKKMTDDIMYFFKRPDLMYL